MKLLKVKRLIHQSIFKGISRFSLHDVLLGVFVGQSNRRHDVGAQVHQQDGHRPKRQWNPHGHIQLKIF